MTSDAVEQFRAFVSDTKIPVVSTMTGTGTLPSDSELYYGMVGSHGVKKANMLLNRADLVLILGARLGDRTVSNAKKLGETARLIHIDIDPAEIGKSIQPYIPVVGDVGEVLSQMQPLLDGYTAPAEWLAQVAEISKACTTQESGEDRGFVNPRYFLERLSELAGRAAYISTEVGQNQLWTANHYHFQNPRNFITSAGCGTMGYGLPAAIGAACATKHPVIAVMGDGSFQMDFAELGTMCQWDIPVKMVLFENYRLGMVHEHQYLYYQANYQAVQLDGSPDFEKLAEAYGIPAEKIDENHEIDAAIQRMLRAKGSYLLIVSVDPYEPTGGDLNGCVFREGAK